MSVIIKAARTDETMIEWHYSHPLQCWRFWKELCETGRAPDTGDALIRAYYFGPKRIGGPDKVWMS